MPIVLCILSRDCVMFPTFALAASILYNGICRLEARAVSVSISDKCILSLEAYYIPNNDFLPILSKKYFPADPADLFCA
jgi:hypothetical protein